MPNVNNKADVPTIGTLDFMAKDEDLQAMYVFLAKWLPMEGDHLDVGCGAGNLVSFASRRGLRARGLDGDESNVLNARTQGLDVFVGDARCPSVEDGVQFDVITMIHLVEHFAPPEAEQLLVANIRLLRPGGRLIIVTPNFADWSVVSNVFWLDPTHVRPYPPLLLTKMLTKLELDVVHCSTHRLVRSGLRQTLARPLGRLRFGREFERMNLILIADRPLDG